MISLQIQATIYWSAKYSQKQYTFKRDVKIKNMLTDTEENQISQNNNEPLTHNFRGH